MGIPVESFAEQHWGRLALLSQGDPERGFDDLFSAAAVDELLSERALRTPFVRMAKEGDVLPASRFTGSGGYGAEVGDQIDSAKVLAEFAAGSTIVLQGLHRTWPPLVAFTRALVRELGHPAQVNAYVTPASSRGFDPHYDVHDVFVLQVAGQKRWVIHEPVHPLPFSDEPWSQHEAAVAERAAGAPMIDTVLRPGDALYLPRGWIHSATALGGTTVHLTIGVPAHTRSDLARELMAGMLRSPDLRASLPVGIDLSDAEQLRPHLAEIVGTLTRLLDEPVDADAIATTLGPRAASMGRPEPVRPLATVDAIAELAPGQRVRWRDGLRAQVATAGEHAVLELPDRTVRFPSSCATALRSLLSGEATSAGALAGLDEPDSLTVTRRLLREAAVVLVTPA
jgi:hypothetical protein